MFFMFQSFFNSFRFLFLNVRFDIESCSALSYVVTSADTWLYVLQQSVLKNFSFIGYNICFFHLSITYLLKYNMLVEAHLILSAFLLYCFNVPNPWFFKDILVSSYYLYSFFYINGFRKFESDSVANGFSKLQFQFLKSFRVIRNS